jgi:hypothetical protein
MFGAHLPRVNVGAILLLALVCGPCASALASAWQSQVNFKTPSGNVNCTLGTTGANTSVECWVLSATCYNREIGMRVASAWALPSLGGGKPKRFCPGDFVPATTVLRYGRRVHRGDITCRSMPSGLRCDRRGHGFLLSRERQTTW